MSTQELYQLYLKHSKVVIDSRKVESGSLFFAIKGERFDGNQFAAAYRSRFGDRGGDGLWPLRGRLRGGLP